MKYRNLVCVAVLGSAVAVACGNDQGDTYGDLDVAVEDMLIATATIQAGAICEAGGTLVQTGPDENGNGTLDSSEVTDSYNVCSGPDRSGNTGVDGVSGEPGESGLPGQNGTPGQNGASGQNGTPGSAGPNGAVVFTSTSAASLSDCPGGGVIIASGADDDADGILDTVEIETSVTICNGAPGPDSCAPVMRITQVGPSAQCAAGGIEIASGPDTGIPNGGGGAGGASSAEACDGVLTPGEELLSRVICQGVDGTDGNDGSDGSDGEDGVPGADGQDGEDGLNQLIKVTNLSPGAECTDGGFMVEQGLDDDRNGSLDVGEVDYSNNLCVDADHDGDGVDNGSDNCVGVHNPGQMDQDGDGEGDACDSTPCVGACEANCSYLLQQGNFASGEYAIDPLGTGAIMGYCDMATDGGGWTLVLNYSHAGGTNPAIQPRSTDLPLLNPTTTFGTDESGTPYWGHTSNALFAALNADEIRFWSDSPNPGTGGVGMPGRTMHFKTSVCIPYFETGLGSCDGIQFGYTTLAGHDALLPGAAQNEYSNEGDEAMTDFPFWLSGTHHWGIRGLGGRWESDDFSGGSQYNTWHQIWSRTYVPATICSQAPEGGTVNLSCPVGTVMQSIDFSSYGTHAGNCANDNLAQSACHSTQSQGDVETLCLGNSSCSVPATNGQFGDPCVGTVKRLAVQAVCQ